MNSPKWGFTEGTEFILSGMLVEGSKQVQSDGHEDSYIYRGIGARQFRQTFALADHVRVLGSELKDGILRIDLVREIPEEKKPRLIEIA